MVKTLMEELETPRAQLPKYQQEVEQILGVELLPEYVPYPEEPGSLREIAYSAVLRMIASERLHQRKQVVDGDDYDARVWTAQWQLAQSRDIVRDENVEDVRLLATHVSMANDIARGAAGASFNPELNSQRALFQSHVAKRMWHYAEYPGKSILYPNDPSIQNRVKGGGLAIVAPPGSGKTHLASAFLNKARIGEPLFPGSLERRRALVIVSSQALLRQYLGEIGDDTFRNGLDNKPSIGAVWQRDIENDKDITIAIAQSLPRLIDDGKIDLAAYAVTVVDEAHCTLRPKFFERLSELGTKLLFFTATPAYDGFRDLRNFFSSVGEGRLRDFVERGILNPVCLQTYKAERGKQAALAVHLGVQAVRNGHKVVIYCRPSSKSAEEAEKDYIARRMNEELGACPEQPMVEVLSKVGNHRTRSEGVLQRFIEGSVRAVTTVSMIREGHNDPDIDGVILLGPNTSMVDVVQKAGRCMRIGNKLSFILEVLPSGEMYMGHYSIWEAFDLEVMFKRRMIFNRDEQPLPDWPRDMLNFLTPQELGHVIDNRPVREVVLPKKHLRQQEFIDAGAKQLDALSDELLVPKRWLERVFDEQKFPYMVMRNFEKEDGTFARWYTKDAEEYLSEHPDFLDQVFSIAPALTLLGITRRVFYDICKEKGVTGRVVNARRQYTLRDLCIVEKGLDIYPVADDDDVPLAALRTEFVELAMDKEFITRYLNQHKGVVVKTKRRRHATGAGALMDHITQAEADRIRAASKEIAVATNEHISMSEVAALAGVTLRGTVASLSDTERANLVKLRSAPKAKPGKYLKRPEGLALVDRLARVRLPISLVPVQLISARIEADRRRISEHLNASTDVTMLNLGIKGGMTSCISWRAMRKLERVLPVKEDIPPIDYDLIISEHPGATRYARDVLTQYIDDEKIQPINDWKTIKESCEQVTCTPAALPYLIASTTICREDFVKQTDQGTLVHDDLLCRIKRKPVATPPLDWVSHTRMVQRVQQTGMTLEVQPLNDHWILGWSDSGLIDVYYSLDYAQKILKRALVRRRRQG